LPFFAQGAKADEAKAAMPILSAWTTTPDIKVGKMDFDAADRPA
jgi:hypothetical protein